MDLIKFLNGEQVSRIRLGLREMIVNAIEHGNLGITFEEKTNALSTSSFTELVKTRQSDPKNINKKVFISFYLDEKKVVFKIRDQGKGFN